MGKKMNWKGEPMGAYDCDCINNLEYDRRERKAQLSKEGTTKGATSDLISRMETVERLRRVLDATVPITDYDEGYVDGVEFGISTVSTMPTIQPQSTAGQLNDSAQSTNLIDRQAAIDALDKLHKEDIEDYGCEIPEGFNQDNLDRAIFAIKQLPTIQPAATDTNVGDKISKFIDGLEEIFADLRERHVDDSVCGLCEYDGAYMGQSGDWCNECPGFEKDDCFKLSDETRRKWTEEIIKALPTVQPENAQINAWKDSIDRQTTIDAINTWDKFGVDERGKLVRWHEGLEPYVHLRDVLTAIVNLPSAQPERPKGEWIDYMEDGYVECPFCHSATNCNGNKDELHFCFSCGADMRGVRKNG